jgi:small subunit ribosomal protein S21
MAACNIKVTNVNKFGKKLDNERMIRNFKKKCEKSGIIQDLRNHEFYTPPSIKKKLKSKMARQRVEKENAKKQAFLNRFNNDKQ